MQLLVKWAGWTWKKLSEITHHSSWSCLLKIVCHWVTSENSIDRFDCDQHSKLKSIKLCIFRLRFIFSQFSHLITRVPPIKMKNYFNFFIFNFFSRNEKPRLLRSHKKTFVCEAVRSKNFLINEKIKHASWFFFFLYIIILYL